MESLKNEALLTLNERNEFHDFVMLTLQANTRIYIK